jgi:hypothetical protein
MPLWLVFALLALVKFVMATAMLWVTLRSDTAMSAMDDGPRSDSDDEGGSKTLPGVPKDPHPRLPLPRKPRRGSHGSPSPPSPKRVRRGGMRIGARTSGC